MRGELAESCHVDPFIVIYAALITSDLFCVQMLSQNLRGEMIAHLKGAKLTLSDSRFIQVIAKSLSISCKEVRHLDLFLIQFTFHS